MSMKYFIMPHGNINQSIILFCFNVPSTIYGIEFKSHLPFRTIKRLICLPYHCLDFSMYAHCCLHCQASEFPKPFKF